MCEPITIWTAIGALGTVGGVFYISKQIRQAGKIASYEYMAKVDDWFDAISKLKVRKIVSGEIHSLLEKGEELNEKLFNLLSEKDNEFNGNVETILDHFELLGCMIRDEVCSVNLTWDLHSWCIYGYWHALQGYVFRYRKNHKNDNSFYREFENLYDVMVKYHQAEHAKSFKELGRIDLVNFLKDEKELAIP